MEFRILSNVRIAPKYFGIALIRNTNEINLASKIHSRGLQKYKSNHCTKIGFI